jgi:hypothetical protein
MTMHLPRSVTKNLNQLQKTIHQRNILKNNFQAKKLLDLGLYEQAVQLQKPTTETITKSSEDTKKELQLIESELNKVKRTIENEGELTRQNDKNIIPIISDSAKQSLLPIKPLNKIQQYDNKYVPQKTSKTINKSGETFTICDITKHRIYIHRIK